MQECWVDSNRWPLVLRTVHQFVDDLRCDADHLLTFPVADQVQRLQCYDDVVRCYARHVTVNKHGKHYISPVVTKLLHK